MDNSETNSPFPNESDKVGLPTTCPRCSPLCGYQDYTCHSQGHVLRQSDSKKNSAELSLIKGNWAPLHKKSFTGKPIKTYLYEHHRSSLLHYSLVKMLWFKQFISFRLVLMELFLNFPFQSLNHTLYILKAFKSKLGWLLGEITGSRLEQGRC